MSSAPVSKRRYQDSDSGPLNLRAERSGSLASWLRLPLAAFLNGRIMQHTCNLFDQVDFAKPKIWLQKCSIITEHLTIFFFARGFAPRTRDGYQQGFKNHVQSARTGQVGMSSPHSGNIGWQHSRKDLFSGM
jgi:hypothetical protein